MNSDLHMWRQWLQQDWTRFKTLYQATVIHLAAQHRQDHSIAERCQEMQHWLDKFKEASFDQWFTAQQLKDWNSKALKAIVTADLVGIAKSLEKKGIHEEAYQLSKLILASEPERAGIHLVLIQALIEQQKIEAAIDANTRALSIFPHIMAFQKIKQRLSDSENI